MLNIASAPARLGSPNECTDDASSKCAAEAFTTDFAKGVAQAILWLASAETSLIPGAFLDVTGGI